MINSTGNRNLTIQFIDNFNGLPVMADKGPFIMEYLEKLRRVIGYSINDYPRLMAFRVDLRLPNREGLPELYSSNKVISRFFESFKAKIESDRHRARMSSSSAHDTKVRYFWVREASSTGVQHYHLLILLNKDAYHVVGKLGSENMNMVRRLEEAWGSALGLQFHEVSGLVEFPDNSLWWLHQNDAGFAEALSSLFHRASYLCKAATKKYGQRHHGVGSSRG